MIVLKRPGFIRLWLASLGAYWLAGIINPCFVWISASIILLILLFIIEDYVVYSAKETT